MLLRGFGIALSCPASSEPCEHVQGDMTGTHLSDIHPIMQHLPGWGALGSEVLGAEAGCMQARPYAWRTAWT